MRIAIVGSGISGLACAWLLDRRHDVVAYEAASYAGGHANTVVVPWQGTDVPVDTGFMVYNERNYPNLTRLFDHLGVASRPSDMSFGVSIDGGRLEYAGSSLATLFAQKRNLLRPGFHRMWCDILRFNGDATRFLAEARPHGTTLGEFLDRQGYGRGFCRPICCRWRRRSGPRRSRASAPFRRTACCASSPITACCRSTTGRNGAQ